ncbi:ABC transporter permease [Lentibacillus sediminis]|uniref:ABC transporter permease n=1 Tax=Lentibacillus sediminis TaxID=1940529 RepID=UPI0013044A23|nr:FtsX-like permease family protein [Lentibacillus sediminis]
MQNSFLVSWRNITCHKKRFFFTLAALVLGVAVMTSMLISKSTFSNLIDEQEQLNAGDADFWVQSNDGTFFENDLAWLQEHEEVEEQVSLLNQKGFAEMETDHPMQSSVRFTGVSDFDNDLIKLSVSEGDVTKEGLIITENTAALFEKEIGDQISFQDMGSLEITAIVHEGSMLNSPETLESAMFQDIQVMVPLDKLQQSTGMENQISNLRFKVNEDTGEDQLLAIYQSELEGSNLFVQPIVADSQQNNDVEGLYYVFDLIAILSIFISSFIAFNMINTSIIERKREIGIMKSLGYTGGNVVGLIVKEIGFLAVIGTVVGLGLGIWFGLYFQEMLVSSIVTQNIDYDVIITGPVIISIIVGILFPFLAAAWPMYKAGKTPILKAMLGTSAAQSSFNKLNKWRIILGVVFTGIGLIDNVWAFLFLFVGLVLLFPLWVRGMQIIVRPVLTFIFRFSGKQALRSIKQFERRNANTAAMLAIGVSLALFMSAALTSLPEGMEDEIDATFGGDIIVEKETPWTDTALEVVRSLEGVENVNPYTEIPNVTWHTKSGELREFSIMSFPDISSAETFAVVEEAEGNSDHPYIYVGERALMEWGGGAGDILTLNTPAGEQNFFVKGSVQTSHNTSYVAFAEENVVKNELNWPHDYHLALDVVDEDTISAAVLALESTFGLEINRINTITLTKEQYTSGVSGMEELMQGLLLLIIAISAIGTSNTLFMNTMERVKEIGTMRAIGFTKRQVQFMIIAEGLFIGIAGVIVGVLYGILVIYLNSISADALGLLSFIIPWNSLLIAIAGGILFTLLASWLPGNSASRISIKEAISYE